MALALTLAGSSGLPQFRISSLLIHPLSENPLKSVWRCRVEPFFFLMLGFKNHKRRHEVSHCIAAGKCCGCFSAVTSSQALPTYATTLGHSKWSCRPGENLNPCFIKISSLPSKTLAQPQFDWSQLPGQQKVLSFSHLDDSEWKGRTGAARPSYCSWPLLIAFFLVQPLWTLQVETGDQENGGRAQSDCVRLYWWKPRDRKSILSGKWMSLVSVTLLSPYASHAVSSLSP